MFRKLKENRRIKKLFKIFKQNQLSEKDEENAKFTVWADLKMRRGKLGETPEFAEPGLHIKKQLIKRLFNPDGYNKKIETADIYEIIAFIIEWEFYKHYDVISSVEEIRSGQTKAALLRKRIHQIGESI